MRIEMTIMVLCTVSSIVCINTERDGKQTDDIFRPKKRMYPKRINRFRPGRESIETTTALENKSTTAASDSDWKPITDSFFASSEIPTEFTEQTEMNAASAGEDVKIVTIDTGYIDHENTLHSDREESMNPEEDAESSSISPHNDALVHYYIPQEVPKKPIFEPQLEHPKQPVPVEQLTKAAVEPVAMFANEKSKNEEKSKDDEFSGKYEYEYFIHDTHWGTKFAHKEFRDAKKTTGNYEVVLPDGRVQHVHYWSDASGYHATVTYNSLHDKVHTP